MRHPRAASRKSSQLRVARRLGALHREDDARRGYGSSTNEKPSEEEVKRAAKYRMAQATKRCCGLCRLVASIKMHTQGMTVEEATSLLYGQLPLRREAARSEAMRGTYDPGYLNYTLGN
jgi:hypothetical protein